MDWAKWHNCYAVWPSLRERLVVVREQIAQAISRVAAEPVCITSICAGDGRDLIGAIAALRDAKPILATLVELDPHLVQQGRAEIDRAGLTDQIAFRNVDATQSSAYLGVSPAHIVLLCGVFGNLKEKDVRSLIAALRSLCRHQAYVIWTRNLGEFDDGEKATRMIRSTFMESGFQEETLVKTPGGAFAIGVHSFQGQTHPLPLNAALFEFSGFDEIARTDEPHNPLIKPSPRGPSP